MTHESSETGMASHNRPALDIASGQHGQILTVSGDWSIETLQDADQLVTDTLKNKTSLSGIDMRQLTSVDTSGAWVLVRLARGFNIDLTSDKTAIREDHHTLFEAVLDTNLDQPKPNPIQACSSP